MCLKAHRQRSRQHTATAWLLLPIPALFGLPSTADHPHSCMGSCMRPCADLLAAAPGRRRTQREAAVDVLPAARAPITNAVAVGPDRRSAEAWGGAAQNLNGLLCRG